MEEFESNIYKGSHLFEAHKEIPIHISKKACKRRP